MSHRDSDSKRRHSKFDREPSPKRHRRDRERVTSNDGGVDREQRNLPLSNRSSKHETTDGSHKRLDPIDHSEPSKYSSQPSRSRSYYQVGRSAGQREADGKVYAQSKENNQRVETNQSREQRDEKSLAKVDDKFHRRDTYPERKDDPTPSLRKRPAFREKKIPVDSGEVNPAGTVTVKSSHTDHPSERNERKEDRGSNPNHLDRSEKLIVDDRAPYNREVRRDGFSSRGRYGGNGGNSNYRGRDKFNGRQDYHPIKTETEKWKHDLYQEVNKDQIAKNEDDQIAKLEALLAS
ncbi:uncharacterized protein LOC131643389 [Vicia villosa]|uniref:uncharacterized protein LOC131643389 n=1 Tax=Vicia villosa TaxID=3911 RepID=UPI00273C70D1|nr:uncharacterized protein LOC131643389 [Vicia villosa]